MKTIQMPVAKTVDAGGKKERKQVGEFTVTVPTLEDIIPFLGAKVTGEEDGLPVYDSDEANFVMSAVVSYVKAGARNKIEIIGDAARVKDGLKIPENWAELCQEGTRGGGAAALAILREAKESFANWFKTLNKSEAATATAITLFSNRAALETQNTSTKQKMLGYIEQFAESLDEAALEKFAKPIENVMTSASVNKEAEDF